MTPEQVKVVPGGEPGLASNSYFRVGAIDRAMALLDETSAVGFEAHVVVEGAVDEEALAEAWRRLAARHPILTCVRVGDSWQPSALPLMGPDVGQPRHEAPPIALRLTAIEGGLLLTLLCNHVAFDGVASRLLLGDLRDEYNAVLEGVDARPTDWSPRTVESVVTEATGWRAMTTALLRGASAWWQSPVSTHLDPGPITTTPSTGHSLIELGPVLEALAPARRRYHWSTDAVLVGVLEHAWATVFGPPSGETSWLVAQDLRPALRVGRGMGNLSVIAGVSIAQPGSDILSVIDRVHVAIDTQTHDLITAATALRRGFSTHPVFGRMLGRSIRYRHYRSVSNVGQLGDSLDRWGSASAKRVWFVGPLAHPPFTSFIAAGRGSSTLVSVRTSPHWLTSEHAAALESAAMELVQVSAPDRTKPDNVPPS
jgi:hypothetical protein